MNNSDRLAFTPIETEVILTALDAYIRKQAHAVAMKADGSISANGVFLDRLRRLDVAVELHHNFS